MFVERIATDNVTLNVKHFRRADPLFSKLFSIFRKKATFFQATIEVVRYGTGTRRHEARPVSMNVRGKEVSFDSQDFVAYGWTRRAARKRCLEKVIPYLREQAKNNIE
jgi:hypothetical protein